MRISQQLLRWLDEQLSSPCCVPRMGVPPTVALYWPIRNEPVLREVVAGSRARGWRLALPVTPPGAGVLVFGRWDDDRSIQVDRMGIGQPSPVLPLRPDVIVLPCVGFSAGGHRLGYGGGYYDRTLAVSTALTVGVGFEASLLGDFQPEPHDRPLHAMVTEAQLRDYGRRELSS